jgi:hypothetical protein
VVYLAPVCAFLLMVDARRGLKTMYPLWMGLAIGSAGILAGEMITYAISTGDALKRMHETERMYVQTKSYLFYEGSRFGWPLGGSRVKAVIERLFVDGPQLLLLNSRMLFLPVFGLIGTAAGIYWKDRHFLFPAVWMISLLCIYNFASTSFNSYTPLVLYHRNLHPIALPAIVVTAGLVATLLGEANGTSSTVGAGQRVFWGWAIASTLVLVCGYFTFTQIRDIGTLKPVYEIRQVARMISPSDTVYTDPLSAKALEFFWRFPPSTGLVNLEGMRADDIKANSFVLIDHHRLDWLKVNVGMWLTKEYGYHQPQFSAVPPRSWESVWQNEQTTLYRVR